MFDDVGQRLLDHAVQGSLDQDGQAHGVESRGVEVDFDPRPLGPPLGVVSQSRMETEVVECSRPQFEREVVDLATDQVGQRLKGLESFARLGTDPGSHP